MYKTLRSILENKSDYLRAETGEHFEDRFEHSLKTEGYTRILKSDIDTADFKEIKSSVTQKVGSAHLRYTKHAKSFIRGPFGSQNYPDFLVFTGVYAIPVEIKYSKKSQNRPFWNSGIPRANGVYIFGSYGLKDITFFLGESILSNERRLKLIQFFENTKKIEKEFKSSLKNEIKDPERRGFMPYIRRAYGQEKIADETHLNFFTHPDRKDVEEKVLETIEGLS